MVTIEVGPDGQIRSDSAYIEAMTPPGTSSTTRPQADCVGSLVIRNARSWDGLHQVKLSPGLNVVVGPSDSGKSNLIRSVLSLVENASLGSMATRNRDDCSVSLQFGTREEVSLAKGKKHNRYVYLEPGDPAVGVDHHLHEYDDVGLSVPDAIREHLRMGPVDVGGESVQLNVQSQRGPVLVVDDAPARVARIVGSVSGMDVIHRAVGAAAKAKQDSERAASQARKVAKDAAAGYRVARARLDVAGADAALVRATAADAAAGVARDRVRDLTQARRTASDALAGVRTARKVADAVRAKETRIAGVSAGLGSAGSRLDALYRTRLSVMGAIRGIGDARRELRAAQDESRDAATELDRTWKTIDACPLCGQETKGGPHGHDEEENEQAARAE